MGKSTILVNGTLYDAVTGEPIKKVPDSRASMAPEKRQAKLSHQVHRRTAQAQTAQRKPVIEPLIQKRSDKKRAVAPPSTRSHAVTKFAPRPAAVASQKPARIVSDIRPPVPHAIAKKAEERMMNHTHVAKPQSAAHKPSSVIKNEAINEALSKASSHHPAKHRKSKKKGITLLRFAPVALSMMLLMGYMTYINLPNLSVRVAANQAGIDAKFPGYRPNGYRLAGVNYDKGSVSLKFAANAGPHNFVITQQQTNWDSTAVKENYVKQRWGDDVVPYSERGLTIYAHEGSAAWVNGGILYTITGDAPLSTTQVRSIATSL